MRGARTVSAAPCGSCPYRRDVPPGIWDATEYAKLPLYDGETWAQSPAIFLCHQNDGTLCAGWVGCHGADELLALRIHPAHPEVYRFTSPVPLFSSGAEAAAHGLSGVDDPCERAKAMIAKLLAKRAGRD